MSNRPCNIVRGRSMMRRPSDSSKLMAPRAVTTPPRGAVHGESGRALAFNGERASLEVHRAKPEVGEGEVVVRMHRAAVGPNDVAVSEGRFGFTGVLGLEGAGVVETIGPGADRRLVGQRVAIDPVIACGECDLCVGGLRAHCRRRAILGMIGRDGCLADHVCVPAVNIAPVPSDVSDDHASLTFTIASIIQASRRLAIERRSFVTVLGDGTCALLAGQWFARRNASVRVLGRFSKHLDACERWGVKHRHIDDVGRLADQDVVIDCTGSSAGLAVAASLVRPRGTIMVLGPWGSDGAGPPIDSLGVAMHELTIIGSFGGSVRDGVAALDRREVDLTGLTGRRVRLSDGPAILSAAAQPDALHLVVEIA
jgi:threonine dehydrogenase-like Zn-dependent dehydrogenase